MIPRDQSVIPPSEAVDAILREARDRIEALGCRCAVFASIVGRDADGDEAVHSTFLRCDDFTKLDHVGTSLDLRKYADREFTRATGLPFNEAAHQHALAVLRRGRTSP